MKPSFDGILTQGQSADVNPGSWTGLPSPNFTYAIKRSGVTVSTDPEYVWTAADVAAGVNAMTVDVTATNEIGPTTATSDPVTIAAPLALSGSPPVATVGASYSFTPTRTGGHAPFTFALEGVLPTGLSFDTGTGEISGTPVSSGEATLSIDVTDKDGLTASLGPFDLVVSSVSQPAPVVARRVTPQGDSWTRGNEQEISRLGAGNVTPTDRWTNQLATLLGVAEYMTPNEAGVEEGVIVAGYGGQKSATIRANVEAIISGDPGRAQDAAIIGDGRNDTPDAGGDVAILTAVDAQLALYPHNRKVVWPPYGAQGGVSLSSASIGSWVRSKKVLWAYREDSRRKYLFELGRYYQGLAPHGSSGTVQDDLDAANDALITSLRVSAATDQQHPNYVAAPLWAAAFEPLVKAMWNEGVYVLDATVLVPFDMAQGQTKEIYFKGHVTACQISQDDPTLPGLFTLTMKPGSNDTALLTRTAASPGNIPRILNLEVSASGVDTAGETKVHSGLIRIAPSVVGAASTMPAGVTLPRDTHATATSRRWPFAVFETSPWSTAGTKFSWVGRIKVGEDGSTMTVWSQGTTRVLIQRTTGNKFAIRFQDSAGGNILNWVTVTTNFTVAAGSFWLFIDIDMNGGAPIAHVWANVGGADVDIAPATALTPGNGSLSLTSLPYLFNTGNAQATFKGSIGPIWAADDVLAGGGFALEANRRLFCSVDGTPKDLGAAGVTGGITPEVYLRGREGDWLSGRNFGSGPSFGFNDNWLKGFGANSSDPLPF